MPTRPEFNRERNRDSLQSKLTAIENFAILKMIG